MNQCVHDQIDGVHVDLSQSQYLANDAQDDPSETDPLNSVTDDNDILNDTTEDDEDEDDDELDLNQSEEFEVGYAPRMRLVQFEKNTTEPMVSLTPQLNDP